MLSRCPWVPDGNEIYAAYHDDEWGRPSRDPAHLFEMICLEGAQAGLSWWTVLQKREHYRKVFHHFEVGKVAAMEDDELESLVTDPGIIRHRGKIFGFRANARAWLAIDDPVGWLWGFVDQSPVVSRPEKMSDYRATSPESEVMSKALKKAGFKFVGPTICYAFMQAVGMVDDHSADCFHGGGTPPCHMV